MRLPLFSLGVLLALSLIVTGCNNNTTETPVAGGTTPQTNSPAPPIMTVTTSGPTSHPSESTVQKFLTALLQGNTQGTVALLTPPAQEQYAKNSFYLNSLNSFKPDEYQQVVFRIIGSDLASESDPNYFAVHVNVIINDDEPTPTVWLVRKFIDEYLVAGMMFFDDEAKQNIAIDFEGQVNPDGTPVQQQAATNPIPANNQQMMQQNPQTVQQFAHPPQYFDATQPQPQFNAPAVQQQPNMNPSHTAQPNTPIFQ